jgi:hypothetical protein
MRHTVPHLRRPPVYAASGNGVCRVEKHILPTGYYTLLPVLLCQQVVLCFFSRMIRRDYFTAASALLNKDNGVQN